MLEFSPTDWQAMELSARVAITATLISLPFGFLAAYLQVFSRMPGKALFDGVINPHARHISLAADANGFVHIVYGDKRNTIDANTWCDFCASAGSASIRAMASAISVVWVRLNRAAHMLIWFMVFTARLGSNRIPENG